MAASDADDQLADFSNFGKKSVDIAAPGAGILSTVPNGLGHEATLISGTEAYQAFPLEFAGFTPAGGLSGLFVDCGSGLDGSFSPPPSMAKSL